MPYQKRGPARVAAQVGAVATSIDTPIIVEVVCSGQVGCAAIDTRPCGDSFAALPCGTYHQRQGEREWRRIADFVALLDDWSFDDPTDPIRLVVERVGRRVGIEVSRAEFRSSSWIELFLGSDAAASVTDDLALRWAMTVLGFANSRCRRCRHES